MIDNNSALLAYVRSTINAVLMLVVIFAAGGCDNGGSSNDNQSTDEPQLQIFPTGNIQFISEEAKLELLVDNQPMLQRIVNDSISLYASTGPGQPSALPGVIIIDDGGPFYSNGHRATFIREGEEELWWFAALDKPEEVAQIIWQVADRPFDGSEQNWQSPPGLIQAGEVSAEVNEFTIDFSQFSKEELPDGPILIDDIDFVQPTNNRLNPEQRIFYVRAIATGVDGNIIGGEPGNGLEILYGDRLTYRPTQPEIVLGFDLLSGEKAGQLEYSVEFPNTLIDSEFVLYNQALLYPWYFRPDGYPENTDTIYIQVTQSVPETEYDSWREPTGLVYEMKLEEGQEDFDNLSDVFHGIPVDLMAFSGVPPKLLYMRAVALSDGPDTGSVSARYSDVVQLRYVQDETDFVYIPPPEVVAIDANVPSVRLIEYQPIQWENPEWMYHYLVVRQPTRGEYYSNAIGISNPDELMANMPVNTEIYLSPPQEDDGSWLSNAWDSIKDFFSSITGFIADITNWISEKYADIKSELVNFVAEHLPLVPEDYRELLKDALRYMVDYGLVTIGVPPELPTFDQLTNMGTDYLASQALAQAGIPANELTIESVNELSGRIAESTTAAATSGSTPNPLNWNFVRQLPKSLYRPAYMILEISNDSDEPSPPGMLRGRSLVELTLADLSDPKKQTLVASFGGWRQFEAYLPFQNIPIPPLLPQQTIRVPVFLKEYIGESYPWFNHKIDYTDYSQIYNNLGEYTFTARVDFTLPPLEQYMEEQEIVEEENTVYKYQSTSEGISFTTHPGDAYIP